MVFFSKIVHFSYFFMFLFEFSVFSMQQKSNLVTKKSFIEEIRKGREERFLKIMLRIFTIANKKKLHPSVLQNQNNVEILKKQFPGLKEGCIDISNSQILKKVEDKNYDIFNLLKSGLSFGVFQDMANPNSFNPTCLPVISNYMKFFDEVNIGNGTFNILFLGAGCGGWASLPVIEFYDKHEYDKVKIYCNDLYEGILNVFEKNTKLPIIKIIADLLNEKNLNSLFNKKEFDLIIIENLFHLYSEKQVKEFIPKLDLILKKNGRVYILNQFIKFETENFIKNRKNYLVVNQNFEELNKRDLKFFKNELFNNFLDGISLFIENEKFIIKSKKDWCNCIDLFLKSDYAKKFNETLVKDEVFDPRTIYDLVKSGGLDFAGKIKINFPSNHIFPTSFDIDQNEKNKIFEHPYITIIKSLESIENLKYFLNGLNPLFAENNNTFNLKCLFGENFETKLSELCQGCSFVIEILQQYIIEKK